jgi:hypothetical protein
MTHLFRSSLIAVGLLCGSMLALPEKAEAGSRFSFSIGVPIYGGGYHGYGRTGWYDRPAYYPRAYYPHAYYPPAYYPYAYAAPRPSYYRPTYYPPTYGPVVSLNLFPANVGRALTPDDRQVYEAAYRRALAAPVGEGMAWNSGAVAGTVTTTRDGWAGERYCREFRQDVIIGGARQEAYGTACQTSNGDWQIVPNQ